MHLACHNSFLAWAGGVLQKCVCASTHVHTVGVEVVVELDKTRRRQAAKRDIGFGFGKSSHSALPSCVTLEN